MEHTQVIQESAETYPTDPPLDLPRLETEYPASRPDLFTGDTVGRIKVSFLNAEILFFVA